MEVDATTVVIANCGWVSNVGFRLGPGITHDDGWLDVVTLRATGLLETAAVLFQLYSGRTNGSGRITRTRGHAITIQADTPRPVQMDGDLAGETPFTATILPGGIEVLV
jgi:diacylglycerol kinase family enzyme